LFTIFCRNHSKTTFNHPFVKLPLAASCSAGRKLIDWINEAIVAFLPRKDWIVIGWVIAIKALLFVIGVKRFAWSLTSVEVVLLLDFSSLGWLPLLRRYSCAGWCGSIMTAR
jgi:hypothetical protein